MKFKYLYLVLLSILLLGCSSGTETDQVEYPDDADIATLVSETLTQMAELEQEGGADLGETPQPAQQDPVQEPGGENAGAGIAGEEAAGEDPAPGDAADGDPPDDGVPEEGSPDEGTAEEDIAGPTEESEVEIPDPGIPGLAVLDLVNQLAGYGFDCFQPELQGSTYVRECGYETSEYLFRVTIWGYDPDRVDLVEVAAFYFGDMDYIELTSTLFELLAKIPYEGAAPDEAASWVGEIMPETLVVGDESTADFGGVRYLLYAFPSAHVLEIGELKQVSEP